MAESQTDWLRLGTTLKLIETVFVRITGKSRNWTKVEIKSVYYTKVGANGGTFVDPRLALAYAEYLNPKLALEVREVFLRHKSGDATLADETLQKSTPEGNEWAAVRALGRAKRRRFTKGWRQWIVLYVGSQLDFNKERSGRRRLDSPWSDVLRTRRRSGRR